MLILPALIFITINVNKNYTSYSPENKARLKQFIAGKRRQLMRGKESAMLLLINKLSKSDININTNEKKLTLKALEISLFVFSINLLGLFNAAKKTILSGIKFVVNFFTLGKSAKSKSFEFISTILWSIS